MERKIWVIVANAGAARIFYAKDNQTLLEVEALVHPESRMKGSELLSDSPGRSFDRKGPGRHAVETAMTPHQNEVDVFSRQVGSYLNELANKNGATKIYIVASPQFLGNVRKHISESSKKLIAGEVNKDVCSLSPAKIREHLPYVL